MHLLMIHSHEDSSATLQACVVLLVSLTFVMVVGMPISSAQAAPALVATNPVDQSWG
jgi:hypothetical protein